jgi:tetratricopeptide (TPR) repeat protein
MAPDIDALVQTAVERHRAGDVAEAANLYRAALLIAPEHTEANHNLAAILAQGGDPVGSLPLFKAALRSNASEAIYWLSYARALILARRPDEARDLLLQGRSLGLAGAGFEALLVQAGGAGAAPATLYTQAVAAHRGGDLQRAVELYRQVIAAHPSSLDVYDELGAALKGLGKVDEAIAAYRAVLSVAPDFAVAHQRLGALLSENGRLEEGFEHFMRRVRLLKGASDKDEVQPEHRVKHDREQQGYLADLGVAVEATGFHLPAGERLSGAAVNRLNATADLLRRWAETWPQYVVMEDFLTPEALAALRRYCAEATIWRRNYEAGYIGATPEEGFACPLLVQIAEEAQAIFAPILSGHEFRYLGAFKYDSTLSRGTNTHADVSAVNLNFYIAPDEANLDPYSGGMEIWDVVAPDLETMRRYNGDEAAARAFLRESGATSVSIPHRANRAILFNSRFFHKTADCKFAEGYLNKRINVSLLFGDFGSPTGGRAQRPIAGAAS